MTTIAEQLAGTTWSLVSFASTNNLGETYYPLGEDAAGYIIFDHTEIFSVQIMADDRLKSLSQDELALFRTDVERQMATLGYHAYSGHFSLDETEAVMTTTVELSLIKEYVGSKQRRSVQIKDDHIYLSNLDHPERQLIWKRKY